MGILQQRESSAQALSREKKKPSGPRLSKGTLSDLSLAEDETQLISDYIEAGGRSNGVCL